MTPKPPQEVYQPIVEQRQAIFLSIIAVLSLIGLAFYFGVVVFVRHSRLTELIPIILLFGFYIWLMTLVRARKLTLASTLVALVGGAGYFILLYSDPTDLSSLFFFYTYPILTFFLLGKKRGGIWLAVFCLGLLVVYGLHVLGIAPLGYEQGDIRDFVVSFAITTAMIYFYQDLVDVGEETIHERDMLLGRERDLAQAVVSSIGEGVFVIDQNQNITSVNPVAARLLGMTKEGLIGYALPEVFRLWKGDQILPATEHPGVLPLAMGSTAVINREDGIYCQTAQGAHFLVSLVASPLLQENNATGVVVVFRDATPPTPGRA